MTSETEVLDAQGVYKLGLIGSLILVVVCLLVLIYVSSKRSQLDEVHALTVGGTPPTSPDPTAESIVRDSYMRPALVLVVMLVVVALIIGIYGAFRVGALGELTLSSYVLLAVSAAFVYLGFRLLESVYAITPEKAARVPEDVYAAVRSAESLITAALALVAFYAAVMYFNYSALKSSAAPAKYASPAPTASAQAPADSVSTEPAKGKGVGPAGGYVDVSRLGEYLSRARASAAAPS